MSIRPHFHLYDSTTGIASYLNRLSGNVGSVGLSFYDVKTGKDIVLVHGVNGQLWRFSDGAWSELTDVGVTESEGIFVAGNGNIFLSPKNDGELYRSTDGGLTFSLNKTLTNSDSNIRAFCEDSNGWIIGGEYPSDIVGPALWRSKDYGDTWESITANLALTVNRHIHGCYYDEHRDLVFITHGDAGATSYVQVSDDGGDTFTSWTQQQQATGMAFDADNIYLCADSATDRDLYRLTTQNNPAVTGETPTSIYSPPDLTRFVWQFHWSNEILLAPWIGGAALTASLYASSDQGDSWHELYETADAGIDSWAFAWQAEIVNQDHFNGIRYLQDNDAGLTCRGFQVIPWAQKINLDAVNGCDGGDGIVKPLKTISDSIPLQRDTPLVLQSDILTNEYLADMKYLIADGNYGFTASTPVADSSFTTGFEAAESTLTEFISTGATIDQASIVNPLNGTRCMRCDAGTAVGTIQSYGYEDNFSSDVVDGDEIYLMGSCYVDQASLPSDVTLMWIGGPKVSGDAAECELFVESTTGEIQVKLNETVNGLRHYKQKSNSPVTFTTQQYVKLKMRIKASDTAGRVTVWVDDVVALDIIGVQTFVAGARTLNDARFGFKSTAKPLTVDWDDVRISINKDPEVSSALMMAGSNQKIHGLKQVSGQVEVGGTDNELIACVANTPTVTPVKLTGINPACYHGTFNAGAKAIENTSSTGLVKNNVFLDQTTQAIDNTGTVDTQGNEYNTGNTFGVTPDATDIERDVDLRSNLRQGYATVNVGYRLFPNKRDAHGYYYEMQGKPETGAFSK